MRLQLPAVLTVVRDNLAVISICLLSAAGFLTFMADRDWAQSSYSFAREIGPPPQTYNEAFSGNRNSNAGRGGKSQSDVSPTVERFLDSDFRASLSRVAKWREQHRRLLIYRQQFSSGAESRPTILPSSQNNYSPPSSVSRQRRN
jgi:hypothetical protein